MEKVKELQSNNNLNKDDEIENFADVEDDLNEILNEKIGKNICEMGTEAGIGSEMNLLPANKDIKCCWNCLKVLLEENSIEKLFLEKLIKEKVVNLK